MNCPSCKTNLCDSWTRCGICGHLRRKNPDANEKDCLSQFEILKYDLQPMLEWFSQNRYTPNIMMQTFIDNHPELLPQRNENQETP